MSSLMQKYSHSELIDHISKEILEIPKLLLFIRENKEKSKIYLQGIHFNYHKIRVTIYKFGKLQNAMVLNFRNSEIHDNVNVVAQLINNNIKIY